MKQVAVSQRCKTGQEKRRGEDRGETRGNEGTKEQMREVQQLVQYSTSGAM